MIQGTFSMLNSDTFKTHEREGGEVTCEKSGKEITAKLYNCWKCVIRKENNV